MSSVEETMPQDGDGTRQDSANQTLCFVTSLMHKFNDDSFSSLGKPSIYRVSKQIFELDVYAIPNIISIGPFHRKDLGFGYMEKHKLQYVKSLLTRVDHSNLLNECFESILTIEKEARGCYSELIPLDSKEFVEMMVLDGLFIIEVFYKVATDFPIGNGSDPIFGSRRGFMLLRRDMILLENQIPMCVLECLLERVAKAQSHDQGINLTETALCFFNNTKWREEKLVMINCSNIKGKHLLDLFYKSFGDFEKEQGLEAQDESSGIGLVHIRCATKLKEAGVTFKKNTSSKNFLNIKFKNGVLEIPHVIIDDYTNCLLRNFLAYEQTSSETNTYMLSYAFLMRSLMTSPEDVAILAKVGIIEHLGRDRKVSALFDKLCPKFTIKKFYYHRLCDEVNKYIQSSQQRWRATLLHNCFNRPRTGL